MSFREFLMNEVRYASLLKAFPDEAEGLLEKTEKDAMERRPTTRSWLPKRNKEPGSVAACDRRAHQLRVGAPFLR